MFWLSIVIPLYNCEQFIAMCLDSILQQGLEESEYEVIIVNDGSTDNGANIVAAYCNSHANFRLINKENAGVSSARNRGIDEAKGEYIYFVDADDKLLSNGLRILYDSYISGKPHPDMVIFRAHTVDKYYDVEKWDHIRPHKEIFRGSFLDYVNTYGFGWAVWHRLISREFLICNNLRFEPFSLCQDVSFVYTCLSIETGILLATSLDIYRYYIRENSACTTKSAKRIEKMFYDIMGVCKRIEQLSYNSNYKKELFEQEMNVCRVKAFARLVYGALPYKQTKSMLQNARKEGFFPITPCIAKLHKVINLFIKSSLATYLLSKPVRYIYMPYIRPRISRN